MNLLFSIDDRFYQQLLTTLYSIKLNSSFAGEKVNVYVIANGQFHYSAQLAAGCQRLGMRFQTPPFKMPR